VRGFNRFQVPLSIDGIRVFLARRQPARLMAFSPISRCHMSRNQTICRVLDGPDAWQKHANAIDRQRYLEAIEAAHQDETFIARSAGVRSVDAGIRLAASSSVWRLNAKIASDESVELPTATPSGLVALTTIWPSPKLLSSAAAVAAAARGVAMTGEMVASADAAARMAKRMNIISPLAIVVIFDSLYMAVYKDRWEEKP